MKFYKYFLIIPVLIVSLALLNLNFIYSPRTRIDPLSTKNNFLDQLNNALNLAKIKSNNVIVRDFQNEIEFNITDENNNKSTKVILSLQKDPYWQIASLQEILKIGRIKGKDVKLIDLSINHPYATI